jgi:asparagine synthetase B (glutamine-hydrolysing)
VRGIAYAQDRLFDSAGLCRIFSAVRTAWRLEELLNRLNGFFVVVHETEDRLFVAVDRARSIPLFYALDSEMLVVSDDARWVREQTQDSDVDWYLRVNSYLRVSCQARIRSILT